MGARSQSVQPEGQLIVGKVPLRQRQVRDHLTIGARKCFDLIRVERTQPVAFAARKQTFELRPARPTAGGKVIQRWHPPSTAS